MAAYSAVSLPSSKTYYHFKHLCQAYSFTGQEHFVSGHYGLKVRAKAQQ